MEWGVSKIKSVVETSGNDDGGNMVRDGGFT